jgi:hypothetical protein
MPLHLMRTAILEEAFSQGNRCGLAPKRFCWRRPCSLALARTASFFSMVHADLHLSALRLLDLYQLGLINF